MRENVHLQKCKAVFATRRFFILADTYDIWGNLNPDAPWAEMLREDTQLPLWAGEVPGFEEAIGQRKPSITFFPAPGEGKRGCVIVMAGGSYTSKAVHEGKVVAQKINQAGVHAAVLDYRVVPYSRDVILLDAKRAVRYLRYHAEEMGILADKIGVLGFSAGGNLAFISCAYADDGNPGASDPVERVSSRPDALLLGYAAVMFQEEYEEDDEFNLVAYFDVVLEKEMQFPPTFLWQSMRDGLINYNTALTLCDTLAKRNVPVEMHLFPYGDHGQGLAAPENGDGYHPLTVRWSRLMNEWLLFYGFSGSKGMEGD